MPARCDTDDLSDRGADRRRPRSGLSSNDGSGSNPRPARSDGLDDVDGSPDARYSVGLYAANWNAYRANGASAGAGSLLSGPLDRLDDGDAATPPSISRSNIEDMGICRRLQRRRGPVRSRSSRLRISARIGSSALATRRTSRPAPRPHRGIGDHENLHVGIGADHGADVAAVEHRARRLGGEVPLERQQRRAHLRESPRPPRRPRRPLASSAQDRRILPDRVPARPRSRDAPRRSRPRPASSSALATAR